MRRFYGMALMLLSGIYSVSAVPQGTWNALNIFDKYNANTVWQAPDGSTIKPQPHLFGEEAGLRMDISLSSVAERFYRDAAMNLNLAPYTEFALAIRVSDPDAISRCSIYFKSGSGWYGGWFTVGGSQWQTITLARSAFSVEEAPAGWDRIEGVRLAIWKARDAKVVVDVASLRGRSSPISILLNSSAIKSSPNEKPIIERAAERIQLWFTAIGLHTPVIDDEDLARDGPPPGCRLLVLPYNPDVPPATLEVLKTFTNRGGKLIVVYTLSEQIAPLLGLGGKRWMKAEPADAFASIRLDTRNISGLPSSVRQDSWNANIPELTSAKTIGTWENGSGTLSSLPAITLGGSGVFVGHLLTNVDRERKMQMLLALSANLVPDLVPRFTEHLRDQAVRLFGLTDWNQTRALIAQTALKSGKRRRITRLLETLDGQIAEATPTNKTPSFGDAFSNSELLHRQIRQAYFESINAVPVKEEVRGIWCHNAAGIPGQPWSATAQKIKLAGFNSLFANFQWAGSAYYPSEVLPVSPLVREQGDLLKQCLDACHREGIALHLWSVLWVLDNAPANVIADMNKAGRLMKNRYGKTLNWLCPANPLNIDQAVKAAVEVVQNYNVDGFHLDYIRYLDSDSCYCANCAARFRKESGRVATRWPQDVISGPDREAFLTWRRNQITTTVSRIRREIKAIRPSIRVSAAVWAGWPGVRDSIGQDWVAWCRDGLLDFVCPMNYVSTAPEAVNLFIAQLRAVGPSVPIYPGIAPTTQNLPPEETVRQVNALREAGAKGFMLFDLDQDLLNTHLPALRAGATSE